MAERVESDLCRYGRHFDCPGCPGCACHPRPDGRLEPIPVVGMTGTTWTADRDAAA